VECEGGVGGVKGYGGVGDREVLRVVDNAVEVGEDCGECGDGDKDEYKCG